MSHPDVRHPDTAQLADLAEGLLPSDRAADLEAHLHECARCRRVRDDLASLPALLAAAGEVSPMPDTVVDRLDAVLLAAAPGTTTGVTAAATITPLPIRDRSPLGMRVLQVAAVLVLGLAGIGVAVSVFQNSGGGDTASTAVGDSASDAGGAAAAGAYSLTASGQNWSPETLAGGVPAIVDGSLGPQARQPAADAGKNSDSSGGNEAAPPSATPESSGTAESPRDLTAAAEDRLAGGPALAERPDTLGDGPVTPLGVDIAQWQGNPATVIVLPTAGDPTTADTWVVSPDCSQADAKVLYFARVARP